MVPQDESLTAVDDTYPRINDVLLGRGNFINNHPGNQQFRSMVDSRTSRYTQAKTKKEKRGIAEQIYAQMTEFDPPVRFMMERNEILASDTVLETAPLQQDDERSCCSDDGGDARRVHPVLLKKTWSFVDREKALKKILHRLREKTNEETMISAPLPQRRLDGQTPKEDQIFSGKEGDLDALDSQWTHSRVDDDASHFIADLNVLAPCDKQGVQVQDLYSQDRQVQDARAAKSPTVEDWQLLHHQLQVVDTDNGTAPHPIVGERESGDTASLDDQHKEVLSELVSSQRYGEFTLREWIMTSKQTMDLSTYIQFALRVALKLTGYLLEAEKEEIFGHANPIPVASITPENTLIRTGSLKSGIKYPISNAKESIEFVWIMSALGDNRATGEVTARLFAIGMILHELFSTNRLVIDDDPATATVDMHSIDLNDVISADHRSHKKSQWRSSKSDNQIIINSISRLEADGIPRSLCTLVKNLLECRQGSLGEEDAYASFADLEGDLRLMINNPTVFLDNVNFTHEPKLIICDKLYGRDNEITRLSKIYERHMTDKNIHGVIISGGAGIGKSTLAMQMEKYTNKHNGYFFSTKFEQNINNVKPFSTISKLFHALCELIVIDSTRATLNKIEVELTEAIGSQSTLHEIVPSLRKLMPSLHTSACNYVDSTLSLLYHMGEFMRVITSHSKPIAMFIDDIQFADNASLRIIGNLCFCGQKASVFFIFCHREDDIGSNALFNAWQNSIFPSSFEAVKLGTMAPEDVNNLVSESLQLSPRLTRPLSLILHRKTGGSPLFLRQLMHSLEETGYIYADMIRHRWAWDIDKIAEMQISDDVLAFLMKQIEKQPIEQQFALKVASCIGSCVPEFIVDYLSEDLKLNLKYHLRQAIKEGFMIDEPDTVIFRFAHDKIQEAVYEMMPECTRQKNHMRFGLCLCTHALSTNFGDDELFFIAVNQINQGGPDAIHDLSQKSIAAELNLNAGRRSVELSDYNTALKLFQHGISFLGDEKWASTYELSLNLHDAASDAAFVIGMIDVVTHHSNEILTNARCFDDKLHSMCNAIKVQTIHHPKEAVESSFRILLQCNETFPRSMKDANLRSDIDQMKYILESISDDAIYDMNRNNDKRFNTILGVYTNLSHFMQYFQPWLLGSICLRMVELTMKSGLCSKSSIAFAYFGGVLTSIGYVNEGRRIGKRALELVERSGNLQDKSIVVCISFDTIFWAFEPLQNIVEGHLLGQKTGRQSGDNVVALKNLVLAIATDYFAGKQLDIILQNIRDFITKINDMKIFLANAVLLLTQATILQDGPNATQVDGDLPSESAILADPRSGPSIMAYGKIHRITRLFLFRKIFDASFHTSISDDIAEHCHLLKTDFVIGIFFEGLVSFQLERINKSLNWIQRGLSALSELQRLNECSSWNWENKMRLLQAENKYTVGEFDLAESLYDSAIQSSHKHKFIHEEAIASELAGAFYFERGHHQKAYPYFVHSIKSYNQWGAIAVAKRVVAFVEANFPTKVINEDILVASNDTDVSLNHLFVSSQGTKKRMTR